MSLDISSPSLNIFHSVINTSHLIDDHQKKIEKTNAPSIADNLPKEVARILCFYLDHPADVIHFALTKHHCTFLISDNTLWSVFLERHFAKRDYKIPAYLYKQLTVVGNNINNGKYRIQTLKLSQNFSNPSDCGVRNISKDIKCHIQMFTTCQNSSNFSVCDGKLLSSSYHQRDKKIHIWDINTGRMLQAFSDYPNSSSNVIIHNDMVILGLRDRTIRVWSILTGQELHTLAGHEDLVTRIIVDEDKLLSASWDRTIKVWDLKTGQLQRTLLTGHKDKITRIEICQGKLVSSSWDNTIKVWDTDTWEEIKTFEGHQDRVTSAVIYNDNKLVSGSWDNTVKMWDLNTRKEIKTLIYHPDKVIGVAIYDNKLFSCSRDGTIKIWDLKIDQQIQIIKCGHPGNMVVNLFFYNGKLTAILRNGTVKVWDFNFPSLSHYSKQILEENLAILGKMAHAEYIKESAIVENLAEQLHPNFKERLNQHSCCLATSFSHSAAVILRVQTEVCIEALLDAIHDKEHAKVSQLLHQIIWINPQNFKIYEFLWEICGRPNFDRWGEFAFHNQQKCFATPFQKEQAVIAFKQFLEDQWKTESLSDANPNNIER